MRAAWYEKQGPARGVLVLGEMPDPVPASGEVRIRISASGVNPGDIKKRQNAFGYGMAYPRVIPHSDGAGHVDQLGIGVSSEWMSRSVWCHGAQSYRPFGTAAEFVVVPVEQIAPLPEKVSMEQGACLGIPGITAHRAVHVAGEVRGRTVMVQGAAGAVGVCAVALARHAGARVIGAVRSASDQPIASKAGAHEVVLNDQNLISQVRKLAPQGVDHIVEVAFGANVEPDVELLRQGGSIASYATDNPTPKRSKNTSGAGFERWTRSGVVRLRNWRKDTACRYRSCARTSRAPGAPWPHCRCAVSDGAPKKMSSSASP